MKDARQVDRIIDREFTPEQKWLMANYPLTRDNPCLNMTDEEFAAYIRVKREAFDYEAAIARDRARRAVAIGPINYKD
jgi:hypothetical protein